MHRKLFGIWLLAIVVIGSIFAVQTTSIVSADYSCGTYSADDYNTDCTDTTDSTITPTVTTTTTSPSSTDSTTATDTTTPAAATTSSSNTPSPSTTPTQAVTQHTPSKPVTKNSFNWLGLIISIVILIAAFVLFLIGMRRRSPRTPQ
jgi:ABC-type transport system involved in multi-copper enzyme maturation permease subunit